MTLLNVNNLCYCGIVIHRYGGRYTVTMLPGDGIGPEMMGYIKDIFREVGAPVDFETVHMDPTTDNYDDLYNVNIHYFKYLPFIYRCLFLHPLFLRPCSIRQLF